MIWISFIVKVLAILAIYGGLSLALERRARSAGPSAEWIRAANARCKYKASRRQGRVA